MSRVYERSFISTKANIYALLCEHAGFVAWLSKMPVAGMLMDIGVRAYILKVFASCVCLISRPACLAAHNNKTECCPIHVDAYYDFQRISPQSRAYLMPFLLKSPRMVVVAVPPNPCLVLS